MPMCLWRLTFHKQHALINSEAKLSSLAQSLLLIKISQLLRLSERLRRQNPSVFTFAFYQTLHLCWICISVCVCVYESYFSLVYGLMCVFTGTGAFKCWACPYVFVQHWENELRNPIWWIISEGMKVLHHFWWHIEYCVWNSLCVRIY